MDSENVYYTASAQMSDNKPVVRLSVPVSDGQYAAKFLAFYDRVYACTKGRVEGKKISFVCKNRFYSDYKK